MAGRARAAAQRVSARARVVEAADSSVVPPPTRRLARARLRRHSVPFGTLGDALGLAPVLPTTRQVTGEATASVDVAALAPWTPSAWAEVVALFGLPADAENTPADLRAWIDQARGGYLAWAPHGERPSRLNPRRLRARLERAERAARELRRVLEHGDAEGTYLRTRLERTGAGAWLDLAALDAVVRAIEDAAADAAVTLPPPARGRRRDDAFGDLVVNVARAWRWWAGEPPRAYRERERVHSNRLPRSVDTWGLHGRFATALRLVVESLPALRHRRGLGDLALRKLADPAVRRLLK